MTSLDFFEPQEIQVVCSGDKGCIYKYLGYYRIKDEVLEISTESEVIFFPLIHVENFSVKRGDNND